MRFLSSERSQSDLKEEKYIGYLQLVYSYNRTCQAEQVDSRPSIEKLQETLIERVQREHQ